MQLKKKKEREKEFVDHEIILNFILSRKKLQMKLRIC